MEVSRNNDFSNLNFEPTQIQKMVFIFNAVNDGWTVKKLDVDKYEFNMDTEKIKKEIVLDDLRVLALSYKKHKPHYKPALKVDTRILFE